MTRLNLEEQRQRVASLLEAVADDRLAVAEALARTEEWKDISWKDSAFADAYHALRHFDADADIRAKDPDFSVAQIAGLKSLSQKLLKMREPRGSGARR